MNIVEDAVAGIRTNGIVKSHRYGKLQKINRMTLER